MTAMGRIKNSMSQKDAFGKKMKKGIIRRSEGLPERIPFGKPPV